MTTSMHSLNKARILLLVVAIHPDDFFFKEFYYSATMFFKT